MLVFKAHNKLVHAVAFSPDGRFLASAGKSDALTPSVRLWSLAERKIVHELPGSDFWSPLAFSLDGSLLARGGYGVVAWSIGDEPREILSTKAFSPSIAFHPEGKILAAHGGEGGLQRWSVPDGKPLPAKGDWGATRGSSKGSAFPTGGAVFSPDGKLFASCWGVLGKRGYDSAIHLWDAQTGTRQAFLHTDLFVAHPEIIRFSPDGKLLAGLYGPLLRVWDLDTATEVCSRQVGKKHFKDCVFLPSGRRLITVSNDALARVWRTDTWTESDAYEWKIGKLSCVAVSPDGSLLAAGGSTGKIVLWDAV